MGLLRRFYGNQFRPHTASPSRRLRSTTTAQLRANARRLIILCFAVQAVHAYDQTVDLFNLTRPSGNGGDFYVGESWRLDVYGGANQQVAISSVHNGGPLSGPVVSGTINGSGFFSLTGSMKTYEIGTWVEWVTAGGLSGSPTLIFDVLGKEFRYLSRKLEGFSKCFRNS